MFNIFRRKFPTAPHVDGRWIECGNSTVGSGSGSGSGSLVCRNNIHQTVKRVRFEKQTEISSKLLRQILQEQTSPLHRATIPCHLLSLSIGRQSWIGRVYLTAWPFFISLFVASIWNNLDTQVISCHFIERIRRRGSIVRQICLSVRTPTAKFLSKFAL